MATQVQLRRGTAAQNDAFTGAQGELSYDTTNKRLRVHDGATAGGFEIKTEDLSGDVLFADNEKAIFGAGSDLQIYHSGGGSFVTDQGAGNLALNGDGEVYIANSADTEYKARFITNGAVTLFYDNAAKFATTNTGVDITGTITSDGLTLDGGVYKINNTSVGSGSDKWVGSDGGEGVFVNAGASGNFSVYNNNSVGRFNVNGSTGDISFFEDTGTTPKFFWDASAESLGINESNPDTKLHVSNNQSATSIATFENIQSHEASVRFKTAHSAASDYRVGASISVSDAFEVHSQDAATSRLVIDSSGKVGINTTTMQSTFNVKGVDGNIANFSFPAAATELKILCSTVNEIGIFTGTDDNFVFGTNSTERMRLDASGNLLVGMTSANTNNDGAGIRADGLIHAKRADVVATFNRKTTDGTVVQIAKDNTVVGSIGVKSGNLMLGSAANPAYLKFGTNVLQPSTSTGADSDNTFNLGSSNNRFKDLYISGGVFLGGVGSSNLLDDYEEGTGTPAPRGSSTAGTVTGTNFYGIYTKIGRQVTVNFDCDYSALVGASGNLEIHGLPYTILAGSEPVGSIMVDGMNFDANYTMLTLYGGGSGTKMIIFLSGDDRSWAVQGVQDEQTGIRGTLTYMTS